ncbi:MAG: hypothetical protein ACRDPT_10070, partial [Streptomycetales bacterium]
NLRRELHRLHVGTFTGPAGTHRQTTTLTPEQTRILAKLDIASQPRIHDLTASRDTHNQPASYTQ